MTDYVYLAAKGRLWGPCPPAQLEDWLRANRIAPTDFCWDAAEGPVVVTVEQFISAHRDGHWPPTSARRRKTTGQKAKEERAALVKERADFAAYREAEIERLARAKLGPGSPFASLFTRPPEMDEATFHGRILSLKGKITREQIKSAYRSGIASCHPDKVHALHPMFKELAERQSQAMNAAYEFFCHKYGIN
jgi:hypothetical protein